MSCPRTVELEAARDGRVADRRALERHLQGCADCRAYAERLHALGAMLRDLPIEHDDELAAQRARHRLLEAFDAAPARPPRRGARWIVVAGAIAATAGATYVALSRPATIARPTTGVDTITIEATHARWSRLDDVWTTIVRLDDGDMRIHVVHEDAPRRLVVIVPDGRIEDVGTTFLVRVHAGQTSEVAVEEGRVSFQHGQGTPVLVSAGEHWRPDDVAGVSVAPRPVPPPPSVTLSLPPAAPRATSTPSAPTTSTIPPRPATPGATLAPSAIERELRDAVAALDAGNSGAAASTLRAIVARYPDDTRAEDAAYLLVVALQRSSDHEGARQAARDYLRRFPNGFRRASVETVAH